MSVGIGRKGFVILRKSSIEYMGRVVRMDWLGIGFFYVSYIVYIWVRDNDYCIK